MCFFPLAWLLTTVTPRLATEKFFLQILHAALNMSPGTRANHSLNSGLSSQHAWKEHFPGIVQKYYIETQLFQKKYTLKFPNLHENICQNYSTCKQAHARLTKKRAAVA